MNILACFFMVIYMASCAPRNLLSGEATQEKPDWIANPTAYDKGEWKAFVGKSHKHAGLPSSREEARINAIDAAMEFYAAGQSNYQCFVRSEVVEYYTEHLTDGIEEWYETYVLALILVIPQP